MLLIAQIEHIVGKPFDCFVTLHVGLHGRFQGNFAIHTGRCKHDFHLGDRKADCVNSHSGRHRVPAF